MQEARISTSRHSILREEVKDEERYVLPLDFWPINTFIPTQ